jgi:hypothetical protein
MEVGAVLAVSSSREQAARAGRSVETEATVVEYVSGRLGLEAPSGLSDVEMGKAGSPAAFAAGLLDEDRENKTNNAPVS